MRKGWVELRLGDFCEIQQGKNLAVSQLSTGKFPVYGANGVVGFYDEYNFSRELVALGCRGSCGTVHLVDEYAWLANNVMAIWPKSGNQAICQFVALLLETADLKSSGIISGQVQPQITRTSLGPLLCVLPPLVEQRRIVDLVASVDTYIAALEQQADTTRTARNAVLHELLSVGGDDWRRVFLGDILTLEYGKPLKEENRDGKGFPVFGSAGEVGLHSRPSVSDAPVIVVGRKGTAGAVWWSDLPCSVIDTAFYVVKKSNVDTRFLYHLIESVQLPSLTAQTGVPGLNRDRAYSCEVALPPLAEQGRIVDVVSSMDEVIESTEHSVASATTLRSGLLSDLLSGDHEIPESYDRLLGAA